LIWLVYREQTDGCKILHGKKDGEHRLTDVPILIVDGFYADTGTA
jgi:hypothetical protein